MRNIMGRIGSSISGNYGKHFVVAPVYVWVVSVSHETSDFPKEFEHSSREQARNHITSLIGDDTVIFASIGRRMA